MAERWVVVDGVAVFNLVTQGGVSAGVVVEVRAAVEVGGRGGELGAAREASMVQEG